MDLNQDIYSQHIHDILSMLQPPTIREIWSMSIDIINIVPFVPGTCFMIVDIKNVHAYKVHVIQNYMSHYNDAFNNY